MSVKIYVYEGGENETARFCIIKQIILTVFYLSHQPFNIDIVLAMFSVSHNVLPLKLTRKYLFNFIYYS